MPFALVQLCLWPACLDSSEHAAVTITDNALGIAGQRAQEGAPAGAPSWARCPAIPSALSVMVTAACSLLSRHAGQRQSCTSANGIYSMRSIAAIERML